MEKEIRDKEKVERVLGIYTKLLDGITVNKQKEAEKYGVVNRSIQRDIDNIRSYLAKTDNEESVYNNVLYGIKTSGRRTILAKDICCRIKLFSTLGNNSKYIAHIST